MLCIAISTLISIKINASTIVSRDIPPSGYERVAKETTYDWCDCEEKGNVTISETSLQVAPNTTVFIHFDEPKDVVTWSGRMFPGPKRCHYIVRAI